MIKIATFKKMIDLNAEVQVFTMITMAGFVFEIDGNGRDIEIDLIKVPL